MYIKIKHLKLFVLISFCVGLAVFNYITFANAQLENENSSSQQISDSGSSMTNILVQNILTLASKKNGQSVTQTDIENLIDQQFSNEIGIEITFDNLPAFDKSQIKIFSQNYSGLSEEKRNEKLRKDFNTYMFKIAYLLASNSPEPIVSKEDFESFQNDFKNHMQALANADSSLEYFSDFGKRIQTFLDQTANIEVPETFADNHVKMVRLAKGFLSLQEGPSTTGDPVARLFLMKKVNNLSQLTFEFYNNDFVDYLQKINQK